MIARRRPLLRNVAGFEIDHDIITGAPLWHDWAKPIVFQWNAEVGFECADACVTTNAGVKLRRMASANGGIAAIRAELRRLRALGVI